MSVKNGKDYLYLVWKEPVSRKQFIIGQLSKNGGYEFSYGFEVEDAINKGFKALIAFEDLEVEYKSDIMFPAFSSRLPDRKRNGIERILKKYDLMEYDEYKLLKRSGAKLPIDNLEFIDPIIDLNESSIKRVFYLAGVRHYMGCDGKNCVNSIGIENGEKLKFQTEPNNKYDKHAIQVLNSRNILVGYIPRYYSEIVSEAIKGGYSYNCKVTEVLRNNFCNECIRAELLLTSKVKALSCF